MIKSTGIFYENGYFRDSYALDDASPQGMGRIAALVLATDLSERPITRKMSAAGVETATPKEMRAFHERFAGIDGEHPGPRPLQPYDGEPAVARTVRELAKSGIRAICVAAPGPILKQVRAAVEATGAQARVARYDADAVAELDAESDGISIHAITRGQLIWGARELGLLPASATGDDGTPALDSLLVVHADQVDFEPRHYRKLRAKLEREPGIDFVVSYVEWRHGTPLLLSRGFLERLARPVTGHLRSVEGAPALACRSYDSRTAIMGEEKLFGPWPLPASAARPDALPENALSTVRAARHRPTPYEQRVARANAVKPDPHVKRAREFLKRLDASLEKRPIAGLDEADAWARRNRGDFPLLCAHGNEGLVYLDSAATSLQPASVIEAGHDFATRYDANIWRGTYGNAATATKRYQAAREKVAGFIGADPREVVFTTNTTTSMNLVADAWARFNLRAGDLVCVMANEHHSNILPWRKVCEETGAKLEFVPIGLDGRVDRDSYERLLARGPRMVCAAQVSNVIGLENPIRKMARAAHEAGAVFVVDAAQSAPHLALDVRKLDADFLAFSGHKMQGPTGIGVLWARAERVREMRPVQVGGGTISEVSLQGTYWRQAPYCFEPGTPPIEQAIQLGAAIDYLQSLGMDQVERHVRAMSRLALRIAGLVPGLRVLGDHSRRDGCLGLLSFAFDKLTSFQVALLLGKMDIAVRAGGHCAVQLAQLLGIPGTMRISFGPYTIREDLEAWGCAMAEISETCKDEVPRC